MYPTSDFNFKNQINMRFSFLLTLVLGLGALTFVGCDDDDDNGGGGTDTQSIAEIVANDAQFSILLSALQQAGLDDDLGDESAVFTVFAPTDAAFQAAGIDLNTISNEDLSQVLLYHVLAGGAIRSTDLIQGQTYATTASETGPNDAQLSLLIERDNDAVTLNGGTTVTTANVAASNGIIHIIDEVLMPPTVVDLALANDNLSELVGALQAADGDLVNVLSDETTNFTVFAPLNSAFAAIEDTVNGLSSAQLSRVLLYHVVSGANVRSGSLSLGEVTTANNGTTVTVSSINPPQLTDSQNSVVDIVGVDIQGTNGVVHLLDAVLIPNNL